jgi:hypothetical protein
MRLSVMLTYLALILFAPALVLADDPPEPVWEYQGLAGTELHSVRQMLDGIYVGAADGLHIKSREDGTWRDLVRDGVAGWPVTAVGRAPFYPDWVITGRVDSLGHGALAITSLADGVTELRLGQQVGPFTQIEHTGYFGNYRVWACAPGGAQEGIVLKSGSGGEVWTELTGHGFDSPTTFTSTLAVVDKDIVSLTFLGGDTSVQSTLDNGETFAPDFVGLPAATVYDLLVATPCIVGLPDKEQDTCDWYFAATAGGLYLKTDAASPWRQGFAEPCTKVCFEPGESYWRVFILTGDGRLLSCDVMPDFSWEWEDWGADLGAVEIRDFDVLYTRQTVATATQGVFEKTRSYAASDVPVGRVALKLAVAPNPFNPTTTLSFEASQRGHARLTCYDLAGRQVATLLDREVVPGPVQITWQPRDLASGVYLARLQFAGDIAVRRVVLVR